MRRQLSITHWTSAKLSLSSCFRKKNDAFNSSTRLLRIQRQVKVSGPKESDRIVAHENVHFSLEITKLRVVFERSYRIYGFQPLAARLPEIASKLERLDCSYLFNSEHRSKLSTDYSSVCDDTELLRFTSLR